MKIFDAHNDFLTGLNKIQQQKYIYWIKKYYNKNRILAQVWTSRMNQPMRKLKEFYDVICKTNSCKNFIFSIEDLGFLNNKNWKKNVKKIIELAPFSCGIVWNKDNSLGGGTFGENGLTNFGQKIVTILENAGVLVDTAHMNMKTFWDFCKVTRMPIFNSHCNLFELNPHARNLNDLQIRKIIESKGIICLSFVKYFILKDGQVSVHDVAKQIVWFVRKYGDCHIGIGTDFFGTSELPNDLKSYLDFSNLETELLALGLKHRQICNIFYKNLSRFYHKFH